MTEGEYTDMNTTAINRDVIPPEHARELRRYLEIGGTVGVKSSEGAMLERAALYGHHSRPCTTCHGDVAKGLPGLGFIWGPSKGSAKRHTRALELAAEVNASLGLPPPTERDLLGDEVCPDCSGHGWVVDMRRAHRANRSAITAKPTGSSQDPWSGGGDPADPGILALLGIVSRRLRALASPHAEVLCAYFLPSPIHESPRAVWPLTPAGKTLLRGSHPDTSPWQAIAELMRAQDASPCPKRAQQFKAADEQAERLLTAAADAWGKVTRSAVDILAEVAQ